MNSFEKIGGDFVELFLPLIAMILTARFSSYRHVRKSSVLCCCYCCYYCWLQWFFVAVRSTVLRWPFARRSVASSATVRRLGICLYAWLSLAEFAYKLIWLSLDRCYPDLTLAGHRNNNFCHCFRCCHDVDRNVYSCRRFQGRRLHR